VPRKQGSTPGLKGAVSADGGPRPNISKAEQIKAIEAKKRKEAHELEKAKLDAIEEKIQAPARELKKRRSRSKRRGTIKTISLKVEPGATYPHDKLTKRRNRDNTIWT